MAGGLTIGRLRTVGRGRDPGRPEDLRGAWRSWHQRHHLHHRPEPRWRAGGAGLVAPRSVRQQIEAVFDALGPAPSRPAAPDAWIIATVSSCLAGTAPGSAGGGPVMVATSGARLLERSACGRCGAAVPQAAWRRRISMRRSCWWPSASLGRRSPMGGTGDSPAPRLCRAGQGGHLPGLRRAVTSCTTAGTNGARGRRGWQGFRPTAPLHLFRRDCG